MKKDKYGIPNGQGVMLLFNKKTGAPEELPNNEAILTDFRTTISGRVCASSMANDINCIGLICTGV